MDIRLFNGSHDFGVVTLERAKECAKNLQHDLINIGQTSAGMQIYHLFPQDDGDAAGERVANPVSPKIAPGSIEKRFSEMQDIEVAIIEGVVY